LEHEPGTRTLERGTISLGAFRELVELRLRHEAVHEAGA
jgi:hypothetical protein